MHPTRSGHTVAAEGSKGTPFHHRSQSSTDTIKDRGKEALGRNNISAWERMSFIYRARQCQWELAAILYCREKQQKCQISKTFLKIFIRFLHQSFMNCLCFDRCVRGVDGVIIQICQNYELIAYCLQISSNSFIFCIAKRKL